MRRLRHARRAGVETLEFLLTFVILMIVTAGCVFITVGYGNALAAQHALSQTALYVAANGRYTQAIETRCEQMLPRSGGGEAICRAFRVRDGQVIEQIPPAANTSSAVPVPFGEQLRIEVRYTQPWFEFCVPELMGDRECAGDVSIAIQRHIDVPSLTREVR